MFISSTAQQSSYQEPLHHTPLPRLSSASVTALHRGLTQPWNVYLLQFLIHKKRRVHSYQEVTVNLTLPALLSALVPASVPDALELLLQHLYLSEEHK